jgi:hypothetical protein
MDGDRPHVITAPIAGIGCHHVQRHTLSPLMAARAVQAGRARIW